MPFAFALTGLVPLVGSPSWGCAPGYIPTPLWDVQSRDRGSLIDSSCQERRGRPPALYSTQELQTSFQLERIRADRNCCRPELRGRGGCGRLSGSKGRQILVFKPKLAQQLVDRRHRQTRRGGDLDLILPEVGNIFWKMQRRGELSDVEALAAIETLRPPPFALHPSEKFLPSAYQLAARYDRALYDSLYLALAVASETRMVTADRKLVNTFSDTDLSDHLLWIGSYEPSS